MHNLQLEFPSLTNTSSFNSVEFGDSLMDHLRIGLKKAVIENGDKWHDKVYVSFGVSTLIFHRRHWYYYKELAETTRRCPEKLRKILS